MNGKPMRLTIITNIIHSTNVMCNVPLSHVQNLLFLILFLWHLKDIDSLPLHICIYSVRNPIRSRRFTPYRYVLYGKDINLKCAKIALVKQKPSGLENTCKHNCITSQFSLNIICSVRGATIITTQIK